MGCHIDIFQGHEPDLPPSDVTIVIDVIRAFTTTHVAFEQGVDEVLLAGEIDEAFALKEQFPDYVLAGERDAIKIEGFDLGNSPFECARCELDGGGMILSTTNGVRATLHALNSLPRDHKNQRDGLVLVTGFTNAAATADYVRRLVEQGRINQVNLLASNPTGDDDLACAEFIRDRILDPDGADTVGQQEVIERIRRCESAQKFLDPDRPNYDRRDVEICMTPRPSDFVMRVGDRNGQPVIFCKRLTNREEREAREENH